MSGFLKTRENMKAEIDASYKIEHNFTFAGSIETDVDHTMTLLNENFKAIHEKLAVIPVTQTMADEIQETMSQTKQKFEKTTCDIIDYKFNKNGKVNVKECHQFTRPTEGKLQLAKLLEILQQKPYGDVNDITFERIDDKNSTVKNSTILEVEPVINLEENKDVSKENSEKEVKKLNVHPLAASPPTCTVAAAGGVSNHKLVNSGTEKLIFKVKSSNNNEYRIKPVFGVVDPGASTTLQVNRTAGAPKEDKLVVQHWPAPSDATDVIDAFKQIKGNLAGTITIPISAIE